LTSIQIDGLKFPECPRWHDGRFWLSDHEGPHVYSMKEDGSDVRAEADIEHPSGLGFLSDGSLLVADKGDVAQILRVRDGAVQQWLDMRPWAGALNDMTVTEDGRLYCGAFQKGVSTREPRASILVLERGSKAPRVAADGIAYPNGMAVTPDGTTLLVSETFAHRVIAYRIGDDGTLHGQRVWADLPGRFPDGLCIDADGAIWLASAMTGEFLRIREGGEIVQSFTYPGHWALCPGLGGDDGRTLVLCFSLTNWEDQKAHRMEGRIEIFRVDVPGVGRP
jgi:sugar lactone lactonase YvrE